MGKPIRELADSTLARLLAERTDYSEADAYDLPRKELVALVLESMTIEELKALPEVADNEWVKRDHRDDVLAAARGEMVEAEREAAAREAAARENAAARDAQGALGTATDATG